MAVSPGQNPDCVFYGVDAGGTWSTLVTDISGEATSLTLFSSSGSETTSARSNLISTRTVDWRGNTDGSDTGVLWRWDRGGGDYSQIEMMGSDDLNITWDGGGTTESYTFATPSGTDEVVVTWAMEPNPDTTGAGDAMRSELTVFNLADSVYEIHTWTHTVEAADAAGTLVFGAEDTSATNTYSSDTFAIRLSSAFHSSTETYETFDTQSSAPTLVGNEYKPFAVPARADVAVGDDGHFAGPVLIMAAKASQQHKMLAAGPPVNMVNTDGDYLSTDAVGGDNWGLPFALDSCSLRLEHLVYRPVHLGANYVEPRVFIQSEEVGASDDLIVWVYSMNWPGPLVRPASSQETFLYYRVSATVTTDHGTGADAGEVIDFGRLKISRDKMGHSYFAIGLDIDNVAGSSARVRDWALDPISVSTGDGPGTGGFSG